MAVKPATCPRLTRGKCVYDFGDTGRLTPLVKMHTLGSTFMPPGFRADGQAAQRAPSASPTLLKGRDKTPIWEPSP